MKKILLLIILFSFFIDKSFAYVNLGQQIISYDKYLNTRDNIKNRFKNIPKYKIKELEDNIKDYECSWHNLGGDIIISPLCFLKGKIPELSIKESLDNIWPHIEAFDNSYDLEREYFEYHGANPIFNNNMQKRSVFYDSSDLNKYLLLSLAYKNVMIKLPKYLQALYTAKKFSYYVVRKDLSNQGSCGLQNFMVAYNSLNNLILKPNQKFNINEHISYLPGYCNFGPKKEPFYGGVCGVSTQLFRIALLSPDIKILERENHSEWRVYYYAEYIYGDDAGIYGDIKNFTIKNTSKDPIFFKTLLGSNKKYNYLVGIIPNKVDNYTTITKKQTGPLSAMVEKNVIDSKSMTKINKQTFLSKYKKKHYGVN